ncbi:MAG TPA: hypothetical protein HPQ00_01175 [Magnetococcales bacterium]|nr:hypothetical protein [Magnetococcales bacterium]
MSQQSKLKKSRRQWKLKASQRADEIRYLKRENKRVKAERDQLRDTLKKT